MYRLFFALLLGLAFPSSPKKAPANGGSFVPNYTIASDTSTGTGGNNGQLPPPPLNGGN